MEFIEALTHNSVINKVCLLRLDEENDIQHGDNDENNYNKENLPESFKANDYSDPEINKKDENSTAQESNNDNNKPDDQGLCLPHNFKIGQATGDGNCFFDSFRQGLEQLDIHVSNHELRCKCKEYAEKNPHEWFVTSIGNSHHNTGVRRETVQQYTENIQKCDRWGDPDVEGRILCECYNISLYVIEKQQSVNNGILYTSQLINAKGCKCDTNLSFSEEKTIYIINQGHGHFEPILKNLNNILVVSNLNVENQTKRDIEHLYGEECMRTIRIFNKLEKSIRNGNIRRLNKLIQSLYLSVDNKSLLAQIYNDKKNNLRETHLITIACKYNQLKILDFLIHKSYILHYLPNQGTVMDKAYLQALCYLMQSQDIHMLETLYDYWSGDEHWLGSVKRSDSDTIITNLKKLGVLLVQARDISFKQLWKHQQMLVDVHCLISFNTYQIELYTELNNLILKRKQHSPQHENSRQSEVEAIVSVLLTTFDVYHKYSNKNIRLTKDYNIDKTKLESLFKENSLYMKYLLYFMYEIYYRKLDYSIALIIINNLHLLKLRLKMEKDTYQEIEAALYYFLYRVNEDWRLYLPENRPKYSEPVIGAGSDGLLQLSKILHDPYRIYYGPVIYLEWQKFKKSLCKFKNELLDTDIASSLRSKIPKEEINSLSLLPYMRDDYSLKKILQYLEQVSYIDMTHDKKCTMLIIQRIIQITGEFFKSTEDSNHLSPTTLALLQIAISKSTYNCIFDLRDCFSHARDRMLIKRIDLENQEHVVFMHILEDFKELSKAILSVIDLYKPIVEKSLLRLGLNLIYERFNELPENAMFYRNTIDSINASFRYGHEIYMQMENEFLNKEWKTRGYSRQLFREIASLSLNCRDLNEKWSQKYAEGVTKLKSKVHLHLNSIQQTIDVTTENNKVWKNIKEDLKKFKFNSTLSISSHPNSSCIKNIKSALKTVRGETSLKNTILNKIKSLKDMNQDWVQIVQLLNFIIVHVGIFETHHYEIKHSLFTNKCKIINNSLPDEAGIEEISWLMTVITAHFQDNSIVPNNDVLYKYDGLHSLGSMMKTKFFLTKTEKDYIKLNIKKICDCVDSHSCPMPLEIFNALLEKNFINEKEFEIIRKLNISERCKNIVCNIANSQKRDNNFLECLVNRVNHLNAVLEGERETVNLIIRYKHDPKFMITLEIIVSDIMNIFAEGWLAELVNTSYTKLLAEYPLRNILEHGNPLLDVSGVAFDADDFPKALVNFALDIAEDIPYLHDLYHLYEDDVDRSEVLADKSNNLNDSQIKLVQSFKKCRKWKSYAKLLSTKQGGKN